MDKGTVKVTYTIGDGNTIFQYIYGRLLAHVHDANLSNSTLKVLNVRGQAFQFNDKLPVVTIGNNEQDFCQYLGDLPPSNYLIDTNPEDYTIYKPHLELIRSWVEDVPFRSEGDLVFHLRLGDRLLYRNEHTPEAITTVDEYLDAIKLFDYDRIHIVTDMKVWEKVTPEDLVKMKFHVPVSKSMRVDLPKACDYFNSLHDGLSELNPIVRVGNSVREDFDYMRSFNQLLFKHGTLAWWAATMGNAKKVGVYGPWRKNKGENNKNLGQTDFDGWFQWGDLR